MKEFHLLMDTKTVDVEKLKRFIDEVKCSGIAEERNGVFYCEDSKVTDFHALYYKIFTDPHQQCFIK